MRRLQKHSRETFMGARRGQASLTKHRWRQVSSRMKDFASRMSVSGLVLVLCILSLWSQLHDHKSNGQFKVDADLLWGGLPSLGWRASSYPRSPDWPLPSTKHNGYVLVRSNGGLAQQRSAICNAVLVAKIMNAALVLPELDLSTNWDKMNGFSGIYDADHFINSLKYDVKVVKTLPSAYASADKTKMEPFQLRAPRYASPSWYQTVALEKLKEYGAVYLSRFSQRLAEDLDNPEYQRLRCRVNYHALRFREEVMQASGTIVQRLRSGGKFLAIHLRFEIDTLASAGCLDIFTPSEQKLLIEYRQQHLGMKRLVHYERRLIGECPLTPEELGLVLQSMGFSNSTQIYLASGHLFGGEHFLEKLRTLFPRLVNRSSMLKAEELEILNGEGSSPLGPAVDYMVSLLSDIFIPNYAGMSNFANNLIGHRLYYGFRATIQLDRKYLAPVFLEREKGIFEGFEENLRTVISNTWSTDLHTRVPSESFFVNPWPECFCKHDSKNAGHECPSHSIREMFQNHQVGEEKRGA